jgi:hypothetical protein
MPPASDKRKNERTYHLKPTRIVLKGRPVEIHDISIDGIGIVIDADAPRFFMGERIDRIPLPLKSGTLCVEGVVTHISKTSTCTICGIRFNLNNEDYPVLHRFLKERVHSTENHRKI